MKSTLLHISVIVKTLPLFFLFNLLSSCTSTETDPRLTVVAELAPESPKEALDSLNHIDYSLLSENDRQYYDFLLIKSRDKAFITHTSDSLILRVIENEENNKDRGRYAEALYYGGRVYHDLGDLPTALNYYQKALDNISEDERDDHFRAPLFSQTSGLLDKLRLYDQALSCAEETLKLNTANNDSVNMMYSYDLLGYISIHAKKYDAAEKYINSAKDLARKISPLDTLGYNVDLGSIKMYNNDVDSALYFLRPALARPEYCRKDVVLSYAALIYKKAHIPDSALIFAKRLIEGKDFQNRRVGYHVLFSKELKEYINPDSLVDYTYDYWDEMEAYLSKNGNQQALIQNSFYNYQVHERQRAKAEDANQKLQLWISGILLVVFLLITLVLYLKNRNKSQLLQLHEAIANVNLLRQELNKSVEKNVDTLSETTPFSIPKDPSSLNVQDLRMHLKEELLSICHTVENQSHAVASTILESGVYEKISDYIAKDRIIPEDSPLWGELEDVVLKSSPEFKHRLQILMGGKMKPSDFHLALLSKCGISSTNISTLIGRAKSTIVYRKDSLSFKIFGEKMGPGVIDDIIHLL